MKLVLPWPPSTAAYAGPQGKKYRTDVAWEAVLQGAGRLTGSVRVKLTYFQSRCSEHKERLRSVLDSVYRTGIIDDLSKIAELEVVANGYRREYPRGAVIVEVSRAR